MLAKEFEYVAADEGVAAVVRYAEDVDYAEGVVLDREGVILDNEVLRGLNTCPRDGKSAVWKAEISP